MGWPYLVGFDGDGHGLLGHRPHESLQGDSHRQVARRKTSNTNTNAASGRAGKSGLVSVGRGASKNNRYPKNDAQLVLPSKN